MPKDYLNLPRTHVRRQDRAVTDETWIRNMLLTAGWGTLATVHKGQPFLNSNLFVFDAAKHALYLHTAAVGRTVANIAASSQVCFTVGEMGRLLPADVALEFSVEYASVVVFGEAEIVTDPSEMEHGLQLLLDKYAPHLRPGRDYRSITAAELKRTAVFRVNITDWTGKQKQVESDFPGAFHYDDLPAMLAGDQTKTPSSAA